MSFGAFGSTAQPSTSVFGTSTAQPSGFTGFNSGASPFAAVGTSNAGGGLFGAPNQQNQNQQPAAGGGLFGSNPQQPAAGGGLFGNQQQQPQQQQQQQQPQAGGGLFGGGATTGTGGIFGAGAGTGQQQQPTSLFGNTQQQQQQQQGQQQQQQPALGSLFLNPDPNNPNQPAASGGATNTGGGGLFGNPNPNPQPFGSTGTTGLFGNTNTTQQPNTGGGLFGNTTTQPATTGLFGNTGTSTAQPAQQTQGLFGNSTFGGATNTGGGLFGGNNAATGGMGLFGQPQQQQQQQPPTSLFGQPQQQQQQQQQPTSLFGASTANQQQPQSNNTGLFGAPNQPSSGAFGGGATSFAPAASTLGNSVLGQSALGSGQQSSNASDQVMAILNAWDTKSQACRFQYYFYNAVPPSEVSRYGRPPNATNEALWQKAVRENPDPTRRVPALATGFDDLRKRADAQAASATAQQQQLSALAARLDAISQKHATSTSLRAQQAAVQHALIAQRLTSLVQVLHRLLPSVRSTSIRPEEENLRGVLEQIEEDLRRPGGMGRMKGKLNELWNAVTALKAVRERAKQVGSGVDGPVEWAVVDEDGLNDIAKLLNDQQQGLGLLTKIVNDDMRDIKIITEGTTGAPPSNLGRTTSPASHLSSLSGNLSRSMLG